MAKRMKKKTEVASKTIFLPPAVHLRLKVVAASCDLTMGQTIKKLLDRLEPGTSYGVDDDLSLWDLLVQQTKETTASAKTVVDELKIKQEAI